MLSGLHGVEVPLPEHRVKGVRQAHSIVNFQGIPLPGAYQRRLLWYLYDDRSQVISELSQSESILKSWSVSFVSVRKYYKKVLRDCAALTRTGRHNVYLAAGRHIYWTVLG
jgi:hypothetical protein